MNTLFLYIFRSAIFTIELGYHVFLSLFLFKLFMKSPSFRLNHNHSLIDSLSNFLCDLQKMFTKWYFFKFSESEIEFNSVINNSKTYEFSLIDHIQLKC